MIALLCYNLGAWEWSFYYFKCSTEMPIVIKQDETELAVRQEKNATLYNIGFAVNLLIVLIYTAALAITVTTPSSYASVLNQSGGIALFLQVSKLFAWTGQITSFVLLIGSTNGIRNLILGNTAIAQLVDKKMILFMHVLISVVLVAYLCLYIWLGLQLVDPNILVYWKATDSAAKIMIIVFLITQFFTQIGILYSYKRLGTNLNTDEESNRASKFIGYGFAQQEPSNFNESQLIDNAMKVSLLHVQFLSSSLIRQAR